MLANIRVRALHLVFLLLLWPPPLWLSAVNVTAQSEGPEVTDCIPKPFPSILCWHYKATALVHRSQGRAKPISSRIRTSIPPTREADRPLRMTDATAHRAFLMHSFASEEDFKRFCPRMRDDIFGEQPNMICMDGHLAFKEKPATTNTSFVAVGL